MALPFGVIKNHTVLQANIPDFHFIGTGTLSKIYRLGADINQ